MSDTTTSADRFPTYLPYIVAALVQAVGVYLSIRRQPVQPLFLLKDVPPHTHPFTMKLPGVSVMYAIFMLQFGQAPTEIP